MGFVPVVAIPPACSMMNDIGLHSYNNLSYKTKIDVFETSVKSERTVPTHWAIRRDLAAKIAMLKMQVCKFRSNCTYAVKSIALFFIK